MQTFKTQLEIRLKNTKRVAVLGIGSEQRGDDAAGMLTAGFLEKRKKEVIKNLEFKVFFGSTAPENLTGSIKKFNPTHLIIIDSANIGKKPGAFAIISPESIVDSSFSTHRIPLSLLTEYLKQSLKSDIIIIGIQPKNINFGCAISKKVLISAQNISNMIKKILTIIFFIPLLSGCRTLRAPAVPYETWEPPSWEVSSQTTDFIWTSIREQKIDISKPLTLAELLDFALLNNPSTREAWEDAIAQEALKGQADSYYYPSASLYGTINRTKTHASLNTLNIDQLNYTPNITLQYLLLDFGGRNARIEEAYQNLLSANFSFNRTIQDILLNTAKNYYESYSANSNLDASVSNLLDARTAYNATKQKFDAGVVSKLDMLQARANYDNALYDFEDAKGRVKTAQGNLANVLGLPADTKIIIAHPKKEIPTALSKKNVTRIIEEALRKRPDISAGRASLAAKEAVIKAAKSDLFPYLNVQGSAQKDWYDFYNNGTTHADDYSYNAFLSIGWDVFDGFNNMNKVKQAEAEAEAEREKLKQIELSASADVWIKFYNFRTSIQKLIASKSFLRSSKGSYELALEGYASGLKSILDLLQAQSDLAAARSQLIQSRKDLFVALADLAHSIGIITTNYETQQE